MGAPPAVRNTCETVDSLTAPSPSAASRAAWCLAGAYVVRSDSTRRSQPSADAETGTPPPPPRPPPCPGPAVCQCSEQAREARVTGERQQEQPGHTTGGGGRGGESGTLAAFMAERSDALTDRPNRSTSAAATARSYTALLHASWAASSSKVPTAPNCTSSTHTRRTPPCCVCSNACAAPPRSILIRLPHSPPSCLHRAPQGTHPPPSLLAPRPHRRFAYPPPPHAQRASAFVRPPPPPPTFHHMPQRAHHAARLHASHPRLGGCALLSACALRGAPPRSAPARFSTASRTDARSSSSPSAPCRLTGVQVRDSTAGRGRAVGLAPRNKRLPTRPCAKPGACRVALRAERRVLGGLRSWGHYPSNCFLPCV